ncbi:MAG: hypothetical protein A2Y17_12125 [Clostridiales bacterium GWF2_38_85]|nr:MAG: hypothetical protein A2Y17_12125 [Clostridiales bacterium GWF2_38_85]
MKPKRISIRFNMENEADRKAWEYLQGSDGSRNKAVIAAINSYFEPVNSSIADIVWQTIRECFQNVSMIQPLQEEQPPTLTEDENALLDSLDDFLGG